MESLQSASKWGDRESNIMILTPKLKSLIFNHLKMDPDTRKKLYSKKLSEQDLNIDPNLPKEFISKLKNNLTPAQVLTDIGIRIRNSVGRGYIDMLQTRLADIPAIVELVVYPRTHKDIVKIVEIANEYKVPLSIIAGGSSVTSGVQPPLGSIAVNLNQMNKVLLIQKDSLYVTAQPGITGPEIEGILNRENLTLGHFPQSFEYSCLGGWVVTRGAGQNSTLYGKIEDMIMGMKLVTGLGKTIIIRSSPAKATGPDWNQLFAGSEGVFGIVTEITLRIWKKPQTTKFSGFFFRSFEDGLSAYRDLIQDGFRPAVMRLSDSEETYFNELASTMMKDSSKRSLITQTILKYIETRGYKKRKRCLGIMSFEGNSDLVALTRKKAKEFAKKNRGYHLGSNPGKSWFETRFELPFIRDPIVDYGILVETFETSTTWENIIQLYYAVIKTLKPECPILWTHGSHFYQNGANLYFTLITTQETDNEIEQFLRIKEKMLNTFLEYGGTISHHHGIGRAYNAWLPQEIGEEGMELLKNIKKALDPNRIMNRNIFGI